MQILTKSFANIMRARQISIWRRLNSTVRDGGTGAPVNRGNAQPRTGCRTRPTEYRVVQQPVPHTHTV